MNGAEENILVILGGMLYIRSLYPCLIRDVCYNGRKLMEIYEVEDFLDLSVRSQNSQMP